MSVKKVLTWLVIAFALFYVIQAPEASARGPNRVKVRPMNGGSPHRST